MSDVVTQRRPMIDLDAFERALRKPSSTDPKDSDPVKEVFRVIPGQNDAEETQSPTIALARSGSDEVKAQPGARPGAAAQRGKLEGFAAFRPGSGGAKADEERQALKIPLISGDFASIEAALLGKPQVERAEKSPDAEFPKSVSSHAPETLAFLKEKPLKRSRAPIYAAAAFITVGLAVLAVSASYDRGAPDELDTEEVVAAVPDGVSGVAAPAESAGVSATQSADNVPLIAPPEEVAATDNATTPLATAGVNDPAPTGNPAELRGVGQINQAQTDLAPPPVAAPPLAAPAPLAAPPAAQAAELEQGSGTPNVAASAQVPQAQVPVPKAGKPKVASPVKGTASKTQANAKASTPPAHHATPSRVAAAKPNAAKPAQPMPAASQGNPSASVAQPPSSPEAPASPPAMSYVQGAVDAIGNTTAKLFSWIH